MKNNNDQAMESYFNSMLSEKPGEVNLTETVVDDTYQPLDNLHSVTPISSESIVFPELREVAEAEEQLRTSQPQTKQSWENIAVENEFQVLFFELSGVTFAVPLIDLGGIHHLEGPLNSLIGKPDWFSGVMTHGESLYNIVDTAKWLGTGESAETLNYSHYILLGSTPWGLSCEKLLGTEVLKYDQVKWREVSGKRPWLAGMVKDRMCVLIHAQELIKLLNSGININGH